MAQIKINEYSKNYSYNIGTSSYACVAMPITASWGPCYMPPEAAGVSEEQMLESISLTRFPATQAGLEAFVSAYRGPSSNYRIAKDFSYQMAMTLLTAGYDILVCRLCPGTWASAEFKVFNKEEGVDNENYFVVTAKYPGTFGNNLRVRIKQIKTNKLVNGQKVTYYLWNVITYIVDASGVQTAVENLTFVMDLNNSTDNILHIDEIESDFIKIEVKGSIDDSKPINGQAIDSMLSGGTDKAEDGSVSEMISEAVNLAKSRYGNYIASADIDKVGYIKELNGLTSALANDVAKAATIRYNEWLYTSAFKVYDLLDDKLTYNPNRVISPGWDDQNISALNDSSAEKFVLSPLHLKLMEIGYRSRCAVAYIDIPKSLLRSEVYNEEDGKEGYAQKLARYTVPNSSFDTDTSLYPTHAALFAPWGQYKYVGTGKNQTASPSFLALMIERAMIINQSVQYEWLLPTNRRHNLNVGKLDYTVNKKLLDEWQSLEGVGVNVITDIPDLGMSLWGNSTLYEVPVATYQALANLSTRKLVNAIKDLVYRCGIQITFQYNNEQAYSSFYAGVTPLLDVMKNQGAIIDYYVRMSADINGLDRVNANTVVGKIYLVVPGVINDVTVDLICLPPSESLDEYRAG